jgi:TRAP-type C4-dicarboxylate transport system permease small subunit
MGLPGMVVSGISIVVGAIMYWAITAQNSATVQNHGFRLSTVGVILMIAGAVGFVTSLAIFVSSRRSPSAPSRTLDREVTDTAGNTTSLHEQQR